MTHRSLVARLALTAALTVGLALSAAGVPGAASAAPPRAPQLLAKASNPLPGGGTSRVRAVKLGARYEFTVRLTGAPAGSSLTVVVSFDRSRVLKRTLVADSTGRLGSFTFRRPASAGRHRLVVKTGQPGTERFDQTFGLLD